MGGRRTLDAAASIGVELQSHTIETLQALTSVSLEGLQMFARFPWFPLPSAETAWLDRVVLDLSDLHDAGAIDAEYFRRAWTCLQLVALVQETDIPEALKVEMAAHLIARSRRTDSESMVTGLGADDLRRVLGDAAEESTSKTDEEGILHLIPAFAIAGRRWDFKTRDADSNRPAPHGHDQEDHSVVLDPYTGEVTGRNGKLLKTARPKELEELWRDPKFRKMATEARAWMKKSQPRRPDAVPELPLAAKTSPKQ